VSMMTRHISALHEWQTSAGVPPSDRGLQKTGNLSMVRAKFEAVMNAAHQGWAQDVKARDRDETGTRHSNFETRRL